MRTRDESMAVNFGRRLAGSLPFRRRRDRRILDRRFEDLLTTHNLQYYADLMSAMRVAIEAGTFGAFAAAFGDAA